MRFLSAWGELGLGGLVAALAAPALLTLAAFIPGRRTARWIALLVAFAALSLEVVGLPAALRGGWFILWVVAAWRVGTPAPETGTHAPRRPGGIESGTIGLLLGLALLLLLGAAVARQDLPRAEARSVSHGVLLVAVGLLHLMLRRDILRAVLAFGAMGLGLEVLAFAAQDRLLPADPVTTPGILLSTGVAMALADRLARSRQRVAGNAWISEAHDLHD